MAIWQEIETLLGDVDLYRPAAAIDAIERAQHELGVVFPGDYVEFLRHANGGDGITGDGFVRLYPLEEVVEASLTWAADARHRHLVEIGSDGGAHAYVLDTRHDPPRILEWEPPQVDPGYQRDVGTSLRELLHHVRTTP